MHAVNFLHRDIELSNFCLSSDQIVRIIDFGLAKKFRHIMFVEDANCLVARTVDGNHITMRVGKSFKGTLDFSAPTRN